VTAVDATPEAQASDPALGAVTVAYVHPDEVATSWHQSMMNLIGHDIGAEQRVLRGGWVGARCSSAAGIPGARNEAVENFLANQAGEWLFWIDTDMGFAGDTIDQLLAVADPEERPIVGALCFAQKLDPDGMGGWRSAVVPTIYNWVTMEGSGETGFLTVPDYPSNALVKCAGTGSACILIHRSVFEKIAAEGDAGKWYDRVPNPTAGGRPIGEDLSFCLRAGALGIPVYVHTGVRTTHFKRCWIGEDDYLAEATLRSFFIEQAEGKE